MDRFILRPLSFALSYILISINLIILIIPKSAKDRNEPIFPQQITLTYYLQSKFKQTCKQYKENLYYIN